MFYSTASLIRDLSLEMPADEKVLWLADGIISRKLEAFCVKHLLPPPENRDLFLDCRRNFMRNLALCVSSHCVADSNLKLLCKCLRRSLLNSVRFRVHVAEN